MNYEPTNVEFGKIVRELRDYYGISQNKLGDNIGMQRGYISLIESGQRFPNKKQFLDILKFFNIGYLIEDFELKERLIAELSKYDNFDLLECIYFLKREENHRAAWEKHQNRLLRRWRYYRRKKFKPSAYSKRRIITKKTKQTEYLKSVEKLLEELENE